MNVILIMSVGNDRDDDIHSDGITRLMGRAYKKGFGP